jgi:hypothetical protein
MRIVELMPRLALAAWVILFASPLAAFAQTDEIQVYDATIAPVGVFNLTWHNNFIADGPRVPAFPGGIVPIHSFNGVTEWAYGVTDWFEAGLYLPLYSISKDQGATFNGVKIRLLFVSPHAAARAFFYGCNFEFSYNMTQWDPNHFTSEIRPIIGVRLHNLDLIANPILDNSWRGGFGNLDFAPAARIAYNFSPKFALAVEDYSDVGPLRGFYATEEQSHQVWAVVDRATKLADIQTGIGFGVTPASDRITLKLMFSRDFNSAQKWAPGISNLWHKQ